MSITEPNVTHRDQTDGVKGIALQPMLHIDSLLLSCKLIKFLQHMVHTGLDIWLKLQQRRHGIQVSHLALLSRMSFRVLIREQVVNLRVGVSARTIPGCFSEGGAVAVDGLQAFVVVDAVLVWGNADDFAC
jgi:hypothetical protein